MSQTALETLWQGWVILDGDDGGSVCWDQDVGWGRLIAWLKDWCALQWGFEIWLIS